MDWIVNCRYVKTVTGIKKEITRICPTCKDEQKVTLSKMYTDHCKKCGQKMIRPSINLTNDDVEKAFKDYDNAK